MNSFVIKKHIDSNRLNYYLSLITNNQYSNGGVLTKQLEERARVMLKIHEDKAIIVTSSGTSALDAILNAIELKHNKFIMPTTQAFTFPCNFQGAAKYARVVDIDDRQQMKLDNIQGNLIIATNCFGHLQNLNKIEHLKGSKFLVYDNAATPYSFYEDSNACNYGLASFVSLHHTKHIGFGEGGLVIIDKQYENEVRQVINFGKKGQNPSRLGGNYKMSEISAAAILQWWDQFNIDAMRASLIDVYRRKRSHYIEHKLFATFGNSIFPSCLPIIHDNTVTASDYPKEDMRKYYQPLLPLKNSTKLYNNIACLPITEGVSDD